MKLIDLPITSTIARPWTQKFPGPLEIFDTEHDAIDQPDFFNSLPRPAWSCEEIA
jgi:hypothetical protein